MNMAEDLYRYHGIVIKAGVPSVNNRVYTEESLSKDADKDEDFIFNECEGDYGLFWKHQDPYMMGGA